MQTPNECRTDNNSDDKNDGKSKANLNNKIDFSKSFLKNHTNIRDYTLSMVFYIYHSITIRNMTIYKIQIQSFTLREVPSPASPAPLAINYHVNSLLQQMQVNVNKKNTTQFQYKLLFHIVWMEEISCIVYIVHQ